MQNRLSRDAFLAATTLPTEMVPIPELGGVVQVRGLSAAGRDTFEKSMWVKKGKARELNMANIRARLVALCVVDESGQRTFSDEDVEALGQVRADIVDRLFAVAQRLSGLGDQDVEELGQPSA
jgi:hypothetical protein